MTAIQAVSQRSRSSTYASAILCIHSIFMNVACFIGIMLQGHIGCNGGNVAGSARDNNTVNATVMDVE